MFRSASLLTLFFSPSYCILRAKSGLWAEVVSLCGSCCREFKEFSNSQIQLYCTRCRHARQPPPSASPLVRWQYTKAGVCLHAVLGTACVFLCILVANMKNTVWYHVSVCLFSVCVHARSQRLENVWWESSRGVWFLKILILPLCWYGLQSDRREGRRGKREARRRNR